MNEDEKLLPLGEPTLHFNPPAVEPRSGEVVPAPALPPETREAPVFAPAAVFGVNPPPPTPKQQQWGVVISIIVIVFMIVVGAFYAWGQRIAEENALVAPAAISD